MVKPKVNEKNMTVTVGNKTYKLLKMKNGSLYYINDDRRPRIVAGSSRKYMEKIRSKSKSARKKRAKRSKSAKKKSLNNKKASAIRAFIKHYSNKRYSTSRGRKIAISRDLHQDNQKQTRSLRKYRKNPSKYDMAGVDMGEHPNLSSLKRKEKKLSQK